jgi:hypothetical protein
MSTLLEGDRLRLTAQVVTTSAAKHQMTVLSPANLLFYGTNSGQVVALPSALTLTQGWSYAITNYSTAVVQIKDFLGAFVARLAPEEKLELILLENPSAQGEWAKSQISISNNPVTNCLYTVVYEANGIAKGKWLNTHSSADSSKLPAVVPFELCSLVGLSFANTQDRSSATIKIYKNGTTDLNVFYSMNILEQKTCACKLGQDLLLKKGDNVSVYISAISNSGFTAESPQVTLFFKVLQP